MVRAAVFLPGFGSWRGDCAGTPNVWKSIRMRLGVFYLSAVARIAGQEKSRLTRDGMITRGNGSLRVLFRNGRDVLR